MLRRIRLLFASLLQESIHALVCVAGRRVRPGADPWLAGPLGGETIGAGMYEEYAQEIGATAAYDLPHSGLIADFGALAGPHFDPTLLKPAVIEFYEHTADFTLDVWSSWTGPLRPFTYLLVALVSPKMEQLNLPLGPLDSSRGMQSTIVRLEGQAGDQHPFAGWLRTNPATGAVVYAGFYTVCQLPGQDGPCVKVVFPVPRGNVTVVLTPTVTEDGALVLRSDGRRWGDPGYYRLHRTRSGKLYGRFFSIHETIHVFEDDNGTLRTDHTFRYLTGKFLELHYKIGRKGA